MANIAPRTCKICGKEFVPNSCRQYYCKELHYRICPICGKQYPEPNLDKFKFPPTTCSMECRVSKRTQTSIERYGISAPGNNPKAREKSRKTMQERYGVDYAQESKEIKQKSINTWIDHYGVDNPQKDPKIQEKTRQTNIERYGSESYLNSEIGKEQIDNIMLERYGTTVPLRNAEIKQHCVETNIQRYGETNPAKNERVREQMRQTSLEKYGVEYPQSSAIVKQHVKDTFIRNYGVDNCFKSPEIIAKIQNTFFNKYGVHGVMDVPEIAERIRNTNIKRYGVPYYVMLPNVSRSSGRISKINKEILTKLQQLNITCKTEFPLNKQSYDIYISQGNILLEVDPTYTHSTVGNHWNPNGIDKHYHLRKTINAINAGYRCIHLWDWDCVSKFINSLTVKNTIYYKLTPELIDIDEAKEFIQQYSLYNITDSTDHILFIGLRYKTKLMLLMGFKLTDYLTNTWTLVSIDQRFQYTVYNGNQIILDHFRHLCNPQKIISYVDYSKSNGEILENLGFEYNRFILPTKIWSKGNHAITDDPEIIPEAMLEDNWLPIYNCGYKVYELN